MSQAIEQEIEQLFIQINECEARIDVCKKLLCEEKIKENYELIKKNKVVFLTEKSKERFCDPAYSDPRITIRPINIAIIELQDINTFFKPIATSSKGKDHDLLVFTIDAQTFRNNYDTLIKYDTLSNGKWHTLLSPYIINELSKNPITLYTTGRDLDFHIHNDSWNRGIRYRIDYHFSHKSITSLQVYATVVFNPNDV